MILVDTSIWIEHFRSRQIGLTVLIDRMEALVHPFVIGELALGNMRDAEPLLDAMMDLPVAPPGSESDVLAFIREQSLQGSGIGYVDAHLLEATHRFKGARLWTRDKRLQAVSDRLGLSFSGN